MTTNIKLRVAEATQDDAYKGIARIDLNTMKSLDLKRGDVVLIQGNKETVAIVDRAYPADIGEEIIRIDGIIRKNSRTGVGEFVTIKKAEVLEAKRITIAPVQENIIVQGDPEVFRRGLLGRAVVKGDIVSLGGAQRRRDLMSEDGDFGDIFGDIMNNMGMNVSGMGFGGFHQIKFSIVNTTPNKPVVITENTEIAVSSKAIDIDDERVIDITYEDIGGLKEELKKVREMIELPLRHPEIFERLGIDPPKGVLLYGPPGTGKTLLAKAVANETEANFMIVNGPEIFNKFYGESEKKIRGIFEEAEKNAPSIIFIDEIDAIAPNRDSNIGSGEVERRVVSQLLTMMDGLNSRGKVVVIAATNRPDAIDSALRRPGRFDREVEINVPNKDGRLDILKIHTRNMPITKEVKLENLASITHGFVGADLSSLAKEAAMSALRRELPKLELDDDEELPEEVLEKLKVTKSDFEEALKFVQPSALREVAIETSNTSWEDIGGMDLIKKELRESVEWPMQFPESFKRIGIKPPKGVLLYGPPGTGKTLLAKAVAKESEANFIRINGPELQKEGIVGKDTERLRKIFKRAKQVSPCIVFFDEIDSIARKRGGHGSYSDSNESLLNTLLTEMDGLEELKNIVVIGATNRPDMLDTALLRPGRFDRILLVPGPTKEGRLQVLKIHTKNMPLEKDVDLEELAEQTEGYVGADIENLVREAAMLALRENIKIEKVQKKHFEKAIEKVKPSVTKKDMETYKKIEENYLRSAKAAIATQVNYLG